MADQFNPLMEAIMSRGEMHRILSNKKDPYLQGINKTLSNIFDIQFSNSGQPLTIKMKPAAPMILADALAGKKGGYYVEARKQYEDLLRLRDAQDETGAGIINNPTVQSAFVRLLQSAGSGGR